MTTTYLSGAIVVLFAWLMVGWYREDNPRVALVVTALGALMFVAGMLYD